MFGTVRAHVVVSREKGHQNCLSTKNTTTVEQVWVVKRPLF